MRSSPITSAFAEAATALRFSFEPSFAVVLRGEPPLQSLGLVRQFGSRIGTLLFAEGQQPSVAELAELRAKGYYCSVLSESYHSFSRPHFEATLSDWGYYGEEGQPVWYTGESWSRPS